MPVYLNIDGIQGESENPQFPGALDVFVSANGVVREAASSGGSGKRRSPNLTDISMSMPTDKSSPNLFLFCCSGKPIRTAEISFTDHTAEGETTYMKYTLENCLITSWSASGDGAAVPTETISLYFTKIKYEYVGQDGIVETATWDKSTNSGG